MVQITVKNAAGADTVIEAPNPNGRVVAASSRPVALATEDYNILNGLLTDQQLRATALNVTGPLTNTQLRASAIAVSAAALPLPTNAATSTLQSDGNTALASIDSKLSGTITVSGGLTDTQLRASALPVTGPVTDAQMRATPISVTLTTNGGTGLNTGAYGDNQAVSGTYLRVAAFVQTYNETTSDRLRGDQNGLAVQPALSSKFWSYAPPATGINASTAPVPVKAAAGASVRNYLASVQFYFRALSVETTLAIMDGTTVIHRVPLPAGVAGGDVINFNPPLRGTANTALNVAVETSATGAVLVNAQGYTGA